MEQNINFGLSHFIESVVVKIFVGMAFKQIFWIAAIAAVTYLILEVFMNSQMKITIEDPKLSAKDSRLLLACSFLLAVSIIPAVAIVLEMFNSRNSNASTFIWLISISIIGGWAMTGVIKRMLPEGDVRKQRKYLLFESMGIIVEIVSRHIVAWIQRIIIGIINVAIRTIHRPFIFQYAIVATIINLCISVWLVSFMGASGEAGAVNMIGSCIGGLLHGILRRKRIREIQEKYLEGLQ
jgi:hypothetical protein